MTEQGSLNQEEQDKDTEKGNLEFKDSNNATENLAPHLQIALPFLDQVKNYYHMKNISEKDSLNLDYCLMIAFEHYSEVFYRFADDLNYNEKCIIYKHLVNVFEAKVHTGGGDIDNYDYRMRIRHLYNGISENFRNLSLNSKFKLTWNTELTKAYMLPILIQALCDENYILETKEEAYKAFQSVFQDEKLNGENVRGTIRSAFRGKESTKFENVLNTLLYKIKNSTLEKLDSFRKEKNLNINEDR